MSANQINISPPLEQKNSSLPQKKKKNVFTRVIIGIIVITAIILVFFLLYYFFSSGSSATETQNSSQSSSQSTKQKGNTDQNDSLQNNSVQAPSPSSGTVPYPNELGSGGVCTVDTDCPLITKSVDGILTPYSQFCVNGTCITNKVCTQNSDCQSIPSIPELGSCDLSSENPSPCKYTTGCAVGENGTGYCIRMSCKQSTDCGYNEACTVNDPLGTSIGVCLPIGNECTTDTIGNTSQCWGGLFGCTAFSGVNQSQQSTGYCTQCYKGNDNSCNISSTTKGGPGSYCQVITGFEIDSTGQTVAPPSVCKTVDNFKYFDCPNYLLSGSTINGNKVCCASGSESNTCGQKCFDDYQCGDNCPYCVPLNGDVTNRVCSCIRVSPYSDDFYGVQSHYSCAAGYGITYDYNTGSSTDNEINPNYHVCIARQDSDCAFSYDAVNKGYIGARGNIVCSDTNNPYCVISSGKCSSNLEGAKCSDLPDGSSPCIEVSSTGLLSYSKEYACTINKICTKRDYLTIGENCTPPSDSTGGVLECQEGLICSAPMGNSKRRVCIPSGFTK